MWSKSTLRKGTATEAVARLEQQTAGHVGVPGGRDLDLLVSARNTAGEAGTR